jgi:hypothetical protein
MPILGLRCSNSDYAYAILDGDSKRPVVLEENLVTYPPDYKRPKLLRWFYLEIEGLLGKHTISRIVIKGAEPMATRDRPFVERTEHEAIVMLAAETKGITRISRKVKATIAKDLGMKGKAKYLDTKLDKSVIDGFGDRSAKTQEAILAGWSELP